jgi:hypothetical protein
MGAGTLTVPEDDPDGRWLAKQREIERLERALADRRENGSEEEVAELVHELADLRVRGVEGVPIEDMLNVVTFPGPGSWSAWREEWTQSGPFTRMALLIAMPLAVLGVYLAEQGLLACAFAALGLVSGAGLIDDRLGSGTRVLSEQQRALLFVMAISSLAFFTVAWPLDGGALFGWGGVCVAVMGALLVVVRRFLT